MMLISAEQFEIMPEPKKMRNENNSKTIAKEEIFGL